MLLSFYKRNFEKYDLPKPYIYWILGIPPHCGFMDLGKSERMMKRRVSKSRMVKLQITKIDIY